MLEQTKQQSEELIEKRRKELEQLRDKKRELMSNATNYGRSLQEKKEKADDLVRILEEEKERAKHSDNLLARIVLMLKRIVLIHMPEEKHTRVTIDSVERYLTLCGLSLEHKATILSFGNHSFPIENINEDTTVPGQPSYLRQEERKEKQEEKREDEGEDFEEEEEDFNKRAREKIKDRKIRGKHSRASVDKLLALKQIEEDEKKEMQKKEMEQGIFIEKETNKLVGKKLSKKSKREEIDHKKKDRTERFKRMQRKYSGSHLLDDDANNKTPNSLLKLTQPAKTAQASRKYSGAPPESL